MKNNSKRICALLLALVMCVGCVIPVFAEADPAGREPHADHVTCPGVGAEHTMSNAPYVYVDTIEPQCGVMGYTAYECGGCGTPILTDWTSIGNGQHTWGNWERVAEPTCFVEGKEVRKCTNDGCDGEESRPVAKRVHVLDNDMADNYLCEEGIPAYTEWCTYEDCDYTVEHAAQAGHACVRVEVIVKAPTCVEPGISKVVCIHEHCSYESEEVVIHVTNNGEGHEWVKYGEFAPAPTCNTAGSGKVKCSVCDTVADVVDGKVGEVAIPAFAATGKHKFSVDVPAEAPDCENPGVIAHKLCEYCGAKDTENTVDPALGHVWADHGAVAPGCTTEGKKAYSECTVCGKLTLDKNAEEVVYVTVADLVVAPQHSYDLEGKPVAESKPTCTKFGFEFYGCTVCGLLPTATDSYDLPLDQNGWVAAGVYRYAMLPHEYDVAVTDATCTTGEVRVYTCSCGDTYTENDDAPGHTWYLAEEKKPSCVADGYKLDKCEDCGVTRIDETTDADGKYAKVPKDPAAHEFDESYDYIATAPTCTKKGQLLRYCPHCIKSEAVEIATIPHNTAIYVGEVAADCENDGYYRFVCDICNDYESHVKASDIDPEDATFGLLYDATKHNALGHDVSVKGETVAPKCDKDGYTVYSCANGCGKTENRDTVSALGHDYSVVDHVVEPTCLKGGHTVYSCANGCGETNNSDFVNPLGHDFKDVVELPVCDPSSTDENLVGKNGKVTQVCSRCSTKGKVTPIDFNWNNADHHPGSYFVVIIRDGDCDKSELAKWHCPHCEKDFYVEDDSMLGDHEPKAGETHVAYKAPTCTESGWYEHYECAKCPKTIYVDANGNRVAYTDVNDYAIPATGHNCETLVPAVDPNCVDAGNVAYYVCGDCGLYIAEDKTTVLDTVVLPAKGHNYGDLIAEVPADCVTAGVKAYYDCADCDAISLDGVVTCDPANLVIDALGHTMRHNEFVEPGCLTPGYQYHYCAVCDYEYVDGYVYADGHVFKDVAAVSVKCNADGVKAHKACENCDELFAADETDVFSTNFVDFESLVIPSTGEHTNVDGDPIRNICSDAETDRYCVGCETEIEKDHPVDSYRKNDVNPTCTEYGYEAWTCSECGGFGKTEDSEIVEPTGHNYKWIQTVAPGSYTEGVETETCVNCGDVKGTRPVAPLGGVEFSYEIDNAIVSGAELVNGGRLKLIIKYTAANVSLANVTLRLDYNKEVLTFVSGDFACEAVDAEGNRIFSTQNATTRGNASGYLVVNAMTTGFGSTPVDKVLNGTNEEFAIVYFDINPDADDAFDNVWFKVNESANVGKSQVLNAANEVVPTNFGAEDGEVAVVASTKSLVDIDNDDNYNSADVNEFLNIAVAYIASGEYNAVADIDQDGDIDMNDYALLRAVCFGTLTYEEACAYAQSGKLYTED